MSQDNSNHSNQRNILVIDDDPLIQTLLKRTLTNQGYQISVASDGEEGLIKAQEICPAMIICDWLMPKINGLEVCRRIKKIPELSTTFFILLTSLDSLEDRVKGLDAGSDDFLCKPIEMGELNARVRAGLRLHQLSNDLKEQKQLLEAELAEAAEYVSSILPEPLTGPPITIDSRFLPSRQLGGDGFDYYWLDSKHLAIYLLDVSGHGLRAALPALSVINLLRSQALSQVNYYNPSDVLHHLNQTFPMNERNDKYLTIWYGVYQLKTEKLIYASAGHPPAILLSRTITLDINEQRLRTPGFPIGMFPESEYKNYICKIELDSSLYLFSDGIYEITEENGNIYGLEKFIELLKAYKKQSQRNLDYILGEISKSNYLQFLKDDLSIMEINFGI